MTIGWSHGLVQHTRPPIGGWARTDPLDRGLIAEWRFNPSTGSTLLDWSGYGAAGTLVNGPVWTSTEVGPTLYFPGANEYVDVDVVQSHINVGEGTLCIFCRRNFADDTKTAYLYESRADAQNRVRIYYSTAGAGILVFSYEANNIEETIAATNAQAPRDVFLHCVGTWSASRDLTVFYINGVQIGTSAALGVWAGAIGNSAIGSSHDGGATWWEGDIALVRLYNRALVGAEVRKRYEIVRQRRQEPPALWAGPWGFVAAAAARIPRPPAAYNTLAIY